MPPKPQSRPRLGRGLSTLIPTSEPTASGSRDYFLCPIEQIQPQPGQPRKHFDDEALRELSESIASSGIIQPLIVRKIDDDTYRLIAGERRYRASQLAGISQVPVVVRDVSDREAFTLALIENIQREDLNPIEEAEAYQHLTEAYDLTHNEVAERVGRARTSVSNALRLLALPEYAQQLLRAGDLSAGHARAILSAKDEHREWLTEQIIARGLNVRAAEALARETHKEGFGTTPSTGQLRRSDDDPSLYTPNVKDAERRLRERIGHQVKIRRKADRTGVIELHFSDDDALNGIIASLLEEP